MKESNCKETKNDKKTSPKQFKKVFWERWPKHILGPLLLISNLGGGTFFKPALENTRISARNGFSKMIF